MGGGKRSYFSPFSFVQLGRFKTFPIVRRRRWLKAHGSNRLLFSAEISRVSARYSYLACSSRTDRLETRIYNQSKNIVIITWPFENRLERYIFEQQTRLEFITTISPFIMDLSFIECFQNQKKNIYTITNGEFNTLIQPRVDLKSPTPFVRFLVHDRQRRKQARSSDDEVPMMPPRFLLYSNIIHLKLF